MYNPNDIAQIHPINRLKLAVETFEHSTSLTIQSKFTIVPKVVMPTNKKTLL